MEIVIKRTTQIDSDFQQLVAALDTELTGRYGEEQAQFDVHNILDNSSRAVVLYCNSMAIACGCFRPMSNSAVEIKRMFVVPGFRSKGYARRILKELENWAAEQNYTKALLETGVKQPEAVAAYMKAGYSVIPNYGPYVASSYSICMQKQLINHDHF